MWELSRDHEEFELNSGESVANSGTSARKKVVKILFDESYGELLNSCVEDWKHKHQSSKRRQRKTIRDIAADHNQAEEGCSAADDSLEDVSSGCTKLLDELRKLLDTSGKARGVDRIQWDLEGYSANDALLDSNLLDPETVKVLVLGAPVHPFNQQTVDAIIEFVEQGGGLLITHDYRSLFQYEQYRHEQHQASDPLNSLLEAFGLRMKRLLSYPPDEISDFYPHYLSSSVNKVFIREPVYLEILQGIPKQLKNSAPRVVAQLPWTKQPFLVATEVEYGRVVAVADYSLFTDDYISYGNNLQVSLNIFRWLLGQHQLDCFDAQIKSEVRQGNRANFSIVLHNPKAERLEHIHCLLESDTGVDIQAPHAVIRSIAPYGRTQLNWKVQSKGLGNQKLKLTIDFPEQPNYESLFFDTAAQFKCLPDDDIDLLIRSPKSDAAREIETGDQFEVQAVFRKTTSIEVNSLGLRLEASSPHLLIEPVKSTDIHQWRLHALKEGNTSITLVVEETEQQVSLPIRVKASAKDQIARLEQDLMGPIEAELQYRMAQLHPAFDSEAIRRIPCHIYTPDDFVRLLKSPPEAEHLLEALQVARNEQYENRPLVLYLLQNIAPTFSPVHGCCIPYDPKLATHLSQQHAQYEDNLAQNFLGLEGADQAWLQQSLAALILHEKYGHGFFFTQTTLGKQLSILYKHGMTRNADPLQLKSPYPRVLYQEYKQALQALWDSIVIVNEGFATWVELAVLPQCSGVIGEAAYRRKNFLFNQDNGLSLLARKSEYFQRFTHFCSSRYQEGCEYFQFVQGYFGKDYGTKCAVQALIKATDINMGIVESNRQVQLAFDSQALTHLLLYAPEDDARADMRLRLIHKVLRKSHYALRAEQKQLRFDGEAFSCEHSFDTIISQNLGW